MLWGSAFHYSTDLDNCAVWDFGLTEPNPNRKVTKEPYAEYFCFDSNVTQEAEPQPGCLSDRALSEPTAQTDLGMCSAYTGLSCCNSERAQVYSSFSFPFPFFQIFDVNLGFSVNRLEDQAARHEPLGYDLGHCDDQKPLSKQCEQFFLEHACYDQCDPYLHQWANPILDSPNIPIGVPVCSDYCDAWFEACKDDLTCADEWLLDLVPKSDGPGFQCSDVIILLPNFKARKHEREREKIFSSST